MAAHQHAGFAAAAAQRAYYDSLAAHSAAQSAAAANFFPYGPPATATVTAQPGDESPIPQEDLAAAKEMRTLVFVIGCQPRLIRSHMRRSVFEVLKMRVVSKKYQSPIDYMHDYKDFSDICMAESILVHREVKKRSPTKPRYGGSPVKANSGAGTPERNSPTAWEWDIDVSNFPTLAVRPRRGTLKNSPVVGMTNSSRRQESFPDDETLHR